MADTTTPEVSGPAAVAEYNPHHLVGSLLDEEEEPIPLLYFTSAAEAFVRLPPVVPLQRMPCKTESSLFSGCGTQLYST